MNNVLFKGTNISKNEGLKMLNKYTEGLEKISSHEDKTFIYTEFGNEEDFEKGGNKIIVDIYYKENLDIEYMNITEVFLIDAKDFNNIYTLKDKYITNWDKIPKVIQDFVLSCDKYWIDLQEVLLYKGRQIVGSIGVNKWYRDVEVNSFGNKNIQWSINKGFLE